MQPFVSHDGQRANGERAEVRVQISNGTVEKIDLNEETGNAQITFKVDNLKFPPKGWTNKREPAYTLIEQAKASGDTIDFRIESQRKPHVDIKTSIEDLLKNEPGKNIRAIIAGVRHDPNNDWTLTSEAVTDPEEDPVSSGGRHSAIGRKRKPEGGAVEGGGINADTALERLQKVAGGESFSRDVIAAMSAQALLAGADPEAVHQAVTGDDRRVREQPAGRVTVANEAPSWKDWNGDGRPNLGRLDVQAVTGVEKFIRELIVGQGAVFSGIEDRVLYYTRVLLAIADLVQTRAYGEGFKADRGASSHSIIRGLIYDTITNYEQLPLGAVSSNEVNAWVGRVGKLVTTRFELATREADESYTLGQIPLPAFLGGTRETEPNPVATQQAAPAEAEAPTQKAVDTDSLVAAAEVPAEPVETLTETATPVDESELTEPAPEPEINDEEESGAPVANDEATEADDTEATEVDTDTEADTDEEAPMLFELPDGQLEEELLDETGNLDPALSPDKEVTDDFKALVNDAQLDREGLRKLVALLEHTFGPKFGKIANIPADALDEFIQFYAATGVDNFKRAVESMP